MFLNKTLQLNKALVEYGFNAIKHGTILPDSYVVDMDMLLNNAKKLIEKAKDNNLHIYFMLKQLGRNPYIAKKLCEMGFDGAVAVDFNETLGYIKHGIKLGHVGHLVQIPNSALEKVIASKPEIMTVYSLEKTQAINKAAQKLGLIQDIMIRVVGNDDTLYSGQCGGFRLDELSCISEQIKELKNVRLTGVCSFPCFLYSDKTRQIEPTSNTSTVREAANVLRLFGHKITQLNMPSANCLSSMGKAASEGATHVEPGHALTGTTPYNALDTIGKENSAIIYASEVSHNFDGIGYCYGGGHYRRGHLKFAAVGDSLCNSKIVDAIPPDDDSIDYHFGLSQKCNVGDAVIMAFRTQVFVTRSKLVLVEGLGSGKPVVVGIYDSQGNKAEF